VLPGKASYARHDKQYENGNRLKPTGRTRWPTQSHAEIVPWGRHGIGVRYTFPGADVTVRDLEGDVQTTVIPAQQPRIRQ
jgi:hypothetical protein